MSITADELAKVYTFYVREGEAYSVLAEDLGREVERLRNEEAAAQTNELYVDRLAQIQYDAECDYALEHHGATLSEWAEATEFQRGVTTAGVVALLAALEADGRLIVPEQWAAWEDVPEGVEFKPADTKWGKWGSVWVRRGDQVFSTKFGVGAVLTGHLNNLAPFVRAEAGEA